MKPLRLSTPQFPPTNFVEDNAFELLIQARQGCRNSLGTLLQDYRPQLLRLAEVNMRNRLKSKFSSCDIFQETSLRAVESFGQFRGKTRNEFEGWLNRICDREIAKQNRYYSAQKRNVSREVPGDQANESIAELADVCPIESSVESKDEIFGILAERNRHVVMLRHYHGFRFAVIAVQMGTTVDVVKGIWRRSLLKLRVALQDE